jgi:hypothetical protein
MPSVSSSESFVEFGTALDRHGTGHGEDEVVVRRVTFVDLVTGRSK